MKAEDEALQDLQAEEDHKAIMETQGEEEREQDERNLEEKWKEFMINQERKKFQEMQLFREQSKQKKKKGKGKKKKKKKS